MAVKKGILDNFLKPSFHYNDNQKSFRSIFIDKNEDDLKPDPQNLFESSILGKKTLLTSSEQPNPPSSNPNLTLSQIDSVVNKTGVEFKPDTNKTQTAHKPDTNITQELNTNQTQSEHREALRNSNKTQTTHKVDTKLNTHKTQTTHKLNTNLTQTEHISTLIGIQRKILLFIFEECKKARSHITEPLSILHIAYAMEIPLGSIKTSISRLCKKHFIAVNSFKNGRGGWSKYEIPDGIYKELLQMETQHKLHTNQTQSRHKVDTKLNTQPDTNASSSNSLNNNNKETTTSLPEDWEKINLAPLEHIKFSEVHLLQLYKLNVTTPEIIQEGINHFAYSLQHKNDGYKNPIAALMSVLRKGDRWVDTNYVEPKVLALRQMLEEEKERKEQEDAMIEKLLNLKFPEWRKKLTEEQINEIVPVESRKYEAAKEAVLRTHFREKVLMPGIEAKEANS